jgi:hypothetical protein
MGNGLALSMEPTLIVKCGHYADFEKSREIISYIFLTKKLEVYNTIS